VSGRDAGAGCGHQTVTNLAQLGGFPTPPSAWSRSCSYGRRSTARTRCARSRGRRPSQRTPASQWDRVNMAHGRGARPDACRARRAQSCAASARSDAALGTAGALPLRAAALSRLSRHGRAAALGAAGMAAAPVAARAVAAERSGGRREVGGAVMSCPPGDHRGRSRLPAIASALRLSQASRRRAILLGGLPGTGGRYPSSRIARSSQPLTNA
jgi:hypothetical protein